MPNPSIDSSKMIDAIASQRLGPQVKPNPGDVASPAAMAASQGNPPSASQPTASPPTQPGSPPMPQPGAQSAPQPSMQPVPPTEKDTAQDKAIESAAPNDPTQKMEADPVIYEIDMGEGKTRKMTPEQIKGISERYSALNYQHAQMKPVLDIVDQMLKANPNAKAEDVANYMMSMLRSGQKNVQMGDPNAERPNKETPPDVDPLSKWEEENAASLPPGYREMMQGSQTIQQQMAQMQQMLQQVLAGASGVADAARVGQQDARGERIAAIQQSIANNIDRAQAQLQLPDTEAENFMMFAAERGYSLEDFVNPGLVVSVMQDFKNNLNSPEFERLADINRRRQAWTGGPMGSAPAAPAGPSPTEGTGNKMFDDLTQQVMARKNMG